MAVPSSLRIRAARSFWLNPFSLRAVAIASPKGHLGRWHRLSPHCALSNVSSRIAYRRRAGLVNTIDARASWYGHQPWVTQQATTPGCSILLASSCSCGRSRPDLRVSVSGGEIAGVASVIDADTIEIHGQRIRLHGIDAPEAGRPAWMQPAGNGAAASGLPWRSRISSAGAPSPVTSATSTATGGRQSLPRP